MLAVGLGPFLHFQSLLTNNIDVSTLTTFLHISEIEITFPDFDFFFAKCHFFPNPRALGNVNFELRFKFENFEFVVEHSENQH